MVRLWILMECLSVIPPSVFHLNDNPLFVLSARFTPKGKPWHTHTIWSKRSRKEWGHSSSPESLVPSLDYVSKKKKKSPKCDSAAKMILLLLHTICSISDSGCFELQKSELAIWDRSCFEPFKLWQDFSLLQKKKMIKRSTKSWLSRCQRNGANTLLEIQLVEVEVVNSLE